MAAMRMRKLRLWQDKIETEVAIFGDGPPLVFLHGSWGLRNDQDFLDLLARTHTVYAPKHPGTSEGDSEAVHQIDDWWDLIVYHGELLDRLELKSPVLVGHSFGGLVACEIAAAMPERVSKLVLIDPVGLWREDLPVKNWMLLSPADLRAALFADPKGEHAEKFFQMPGDTAERIDAQVGFIWSQACTGKFVWPLPDKGLKKHIHRIAAPTLIVWGKADGVIAPAYADEFAKRIAHARVAMLDGAGHMPHFEQAQNVANLVGEFLRD
jgi:pimeloyl-ACP methyl ester carboxylesterase